MAALEMRVFEEVSIKKYKVWMIPIVDELFSIQRTARRVLDVACGPGLLTKAIAERSRSNAIIGIDTSRDAIRSARKNCSRLTNTKFVRASVYHLPFENEHFDTIVCKDSLHHFNRPIKALKEMTRVLRDGGVIYLQDLRRDIPYNLFRKCLPPDTVFKKLQFYSVRASFTKREMKKIFDKDKKIRFILRTRKLTPALARRYEKQGINSKEVRESFQARFVAILRKPFAHGNS